VDQGFVALWAARHVFGGQLACRGFGGEGRQVRDILHPEDLADLVERQLARLDSVAGQTFNVGGGRQGSVSLRELTTLCRARGDVQPGMDRVPETDSVDIPWYITDNHRVMEATGWAPRRPPEQVVDDTFRWLRDHRHDLAGVL